MSLPPPVTSHNGAVQTRRVGLTPRSLVRGTRHNPAYDRRVTTDATTAIQLADAYLTAHDHRRAEEVLGTALATDPHDHRLLSALARVQLDREDYVAAEVTARAAVAGAPHDEEALYALSRALEELGRMPEALDVARDAVDRHPYSTYSLSNLARLLDVAHLPEEALPVIEDAVELAPNDPYLLTVRGDVHASLIDLDAAEADYREALRLDPQRKDALHGLAVLRFMTFRRWSAIGHFLGVARIDPARSETALWNIGMVLTRVLRRATWFSVIVAVAVIVTFVRDAAGESTTVPRVVAGVWAFFLFVTYTRLINHEFPREVLKSVVRYRKLLAVRIVLLYAALVFGIETAVLGAMLLPTGLSVLLIVVAVVVTVVGRLRDERLW